MAAPLLVIAVTGRDERGVGGPAAAEPAAAGDRGVRRGNYTSYLARGIPYFIGTDVDDVEALIARTPDRFLRDHASEARLRHEVTAVDTDRRADQVRDLDGGGEKWEGFDQLMIATGAAPIRPPLPDTGALGIFGVQTLDDGLAVRAALDRDRPRRAVVVGAGYIGLELAEALCAWGVAVTVVDRGQGPLTGLDPDVRGMLTEAMHGLGMTLRLGETVAGFEIAAGRVSAVVTDQTVPTDLVILGLGVRPDTALAAQAGIPLGPAGGIAVARRLRSGVEGVWAAGDCAEKFHRVFRRPVAIALGTYANKDDRTAGINIGGGYATFPGVLGTAVTKVCDVQVGPTGLGETDARVAGFDPLTVAVDSITRAGYYPGARPIRTRLIVERGTGRLLGAQIVGEEGAAKRIAVLATALWHETSAAELFNTDLSYAPPFSPLCDPVLIAPRKAWQRVEDDRRTSDHPTGGPAAVSGGR